MILRISRTTPVALFTCFLSLVRAAPGSPPGELTVVGDSWATGGGADRSTLSLIGDAGCTRNPRAYAQWLKSESDMRITKVNMQACKDQTPTQIEKCQVSGGKDLKDCSEAKPSGFGRPKLIILQAGIEKIGLDQVFKQCVYEKGGPKCDGAIKNANQNVTSLAKQNSVFKLIRSTIAKSHLPPSAIIVINYVPPFNTDTDPQRCKFGDSDPPQPLPKQTRKSINDIITALNKAIASQTHAAKAVPVDVNPRFYTHRWCDTANPWLTGLVAQVDVHSYVNGNLFQQSLFHPNALGQGAYANAVREALGMKDLTDQIPPKLPGALPRPPLIGNDWPASPYGGATPGNAIEIGKGKPKPKPAPGSVTSMKRDGRVEPTPASVAL